MGGGETLVLASREGRVGVIELARPQAFNCQSMASVQQFTAAFRAFEAEPSVRAVLVRAQGTNFCTGADLEDVKARRDDPVALRTFIAGGHAMLSALEASRLPVVAAVQGLALAGGIELALACDVVFAARSARFGDQHAQFGLVPGWGGTQRLPRIIGMRRALDLMLSARWIEAATALDWGLANYVVDDDKLQAEAMAYCATLATRSAPGLALMKRLARDGAQGTLQAGLALEVDAVVDALRTADVAEGLAAFEGRRKPDFD
ncbi:MAG: enoyl-CoA hydratase/isomerase family protein [Alphaproteobacteria bacterium]|nr:enoyl-CoA hydratase/isomerase family protein [Alphaproteobacteria bacterium]